MSPEIIAKLVGLLEFKVDLSGLQRFERGLTQARQKMMSLSREADALQAKLGKKFGIKLDTAGRDKLDKSVRASLDRELKLEQGLQRTKRATFAAELAGMKLTSAGNKENAALQNQATREKIAQAVLDSKSAKAAQERLKIAGLESKQAQTLEAHKLRQQRVQAVLATQQQRTVLLQQRQHAGMTAMQRAEFALQQSRVRAQRATERFQATQLAQKVRADRQTTRTQQQTEKHGWATQRQAAWAAKQAEPKAPATFMGLGTAGLAVGGVAAGFAAVVAAVGALSDRLTKTQSRVSDSQSWANTVEQAAGKNPLNKDFARSEFLRISEKYGTSVDLDAAKEYRTFLLHQMATGKSISKATQMYETQMSAFRGAGMSKTEMQRANIQLTQVRAKGKGDTEDVNTFSEAAPLLVDPIKQAWAERNKHKLDANLEKDFRASFKVGNLKAVDFERGLEIFNQQNQPAIAKQSASIDSNQTRLENAQLLQQLGLDQSPELIGVINDRIKSEIELTEAMKPLKEAALSADIALNKMAASFFRFAFGKDDTPQETAKKVDVFSPDQPAIDPSVMGGGPKPNTGEKVKDPISMLYRWLTNTPDYSEGEANKMEALRMNTLGMQFPKLDLSKLTIEQPNVADGEYRPFRLPPPVTAADIMQDATQQQLQKQPTWPGSLPANELENYGSPAGSKVESSVHNETHNDITVNIQAPVGSDEQVIGRVVRDELGKALQSARSGQTEVE
ncbi:tape measure protein [Pseudomonas gregormendelii]|uniref:Tape measure protein n=1 Tax=Pseudomonas gregormendelii TaxID=1628277 RepID=A0ABS3AAU8_9PSED|nr:tape measure protein [Pseudomonas gregormendelii]MBN3964313.1 tape measure protein [Pseudomonas gregormendelii]